MEIVFHIEGRTSANVPGNYLIDMPERLKGYEYVQDQEGQGLIRKFAETIGVYFVEVK